MSCLCSSASLRIFVRSLAQVHNLGPIPLRPLVAQPPTASRFQQLDSVRRLHGTSMRQQENESPRSNVATQSTPSTADEIPANLHIADKAAPEEASDDASTTPLPRASRPKRDGANTSKRNPNRSNKSSSTYKEKRRSEKPTEPFMNGIQLLRRPTMPETTTDWKSQKAALKEKFPEGWKPRKRLSPDALAGIRALNAQFPDVYTTDALAAKFEVSPEAIRRILKSKWRASAEEEEDRQGRWFRRGMQVWERKAALGFKPPQKWRREGVGREGVYHTQKEKRAQYEKNWEQNERDQYRRFLNQRRGGSGNGTGRDSGSGEGSAEGL